MTGRAVVCARARRRATWLPAMILLGLPLASAWGQRITPAAVTNVWQSRDSLVPSSAGDFQDLTTRSDRHPVLKGVAVGASVGTVSGLLIWAMRTVPAAIACDLDNAATTIGGDAEPHPCNWHAYRRRAQCTWTGLVIGGVVGGIVERLTRD